MLRDKAILQSQTGWFTELINAKNYGFKKCSYQVVCCKVTNASSWKQEQLQIHGALKILGRTFCQFCKGLMRMP